MSIRPILAAALILPLIPCGPAWAGGNPGRPTQAQAQAQEDGKPGGESRKSEVDTEDLFGFTVGSDIGEPGEKQVSVDTIGRFERRGREYRVFSPRLQGQYVPVENVSLAFGAIFDRFSIRDVPGLEDRDTGGLSQLSAEIRYRFVKRDPSPVGLTLSVEPQFGFFDPDTGERARRAAIETRLSLDIAFVPDRVFGALNLIYEGERIRPRELLEPTEREGTIGVSGAVSFQVLPNLFAGAEARYLRRYQGLDLRSFEGEALFLGPTLYAQFAEKVSLTAAWNVQVTGHAKDAPGHLDLENFERHQARLQLKVSF